MAVYAETGHVGGGGSPAHVALPASWTSGSRRPLFTLRASHLSPNTRSALRTAGRVAGVVRWVMLVVATVIMGGVTIASVLGFRVMIVTSGSMRPAFGPGDAVVVRPGGVGSIQAGDVITFRAPGAPGMTTHRVISVRVINGTRWFQTKGDANPTTDPNLVPTDAVYGTQRLALPKLGRFLYLALTPKGKLLLLGLPISFLAAQEIRFLLRARRSRLHGHTLDRQNAPAIDAPEGEAEPQTVAVGRSTEPLIVIPPARCTAADPYERVEAVLKAEAAHLAAVEDALAELERKVAELAADNRRVHASDDLPSPTRGFVLQVALSS